MADKPHRVIVDPAVEEAEDAFQHMMAYFAAMTREEARSVGSLVRTSMPDRIRMALSQLRRSLSEQEMDSGRIESLSVAV